MWAHDDHDEILREQITCNNIFLKLFLLYHTSVHCPGAAVGTVLDYGLCVESASRTGAGWPNDAEATDCHGIVSALSGAWPAWPH